MIASSYQKGGGLSAIDARNGRVVHLSTAKAKPDARTYPGCAAPSEALFTHGIYARAAGKSGYKLYVVGHEPEMIHVFDMAVKSSGPSLTWIGCVATPPGASNAVVALKDGTMLMTIFTFPGLSMGDMEIGTLTGAVYRWRPGETAFTELPGTRLRGDNGIELSADEKTMFVVASGARAVSAFTVADQPQLLWTVPTPIVKPDNIRREPGGTYMIGGMVDDEKACGGKRKLINGQLEITSCHRGSVAVRLDPATREAKVVAHVEQDTDFTGVASAVALNGRVWFSSFNGDRIASVPLPAGQ
jgi:sugar lactone lactonase YvrE